jgi:hypothetical protein
MLEFPLSTKEDLFWVGRGGGHHLATINCYILVASTIQKSKLGRLKGWDVKI